MKLSQLSLADYNQLDSIPVINQDLSASGFTPVANTYYRHTGATTGTFTQGVIYLYDTAYHKLGESGSGGTTLKYTYQMSASATTDDWHRLNAILVNAKGKTTIRSGYTTGGSGCFSILPSNNTVEIYLKDGLTENYTTADKSYKIQVNSLGDTRNIIKISDSWTNNGNVVRTVQDNASVALNVVYYNDTEIT